MARSFTYVVSAVKCDALRRIELSVSPSVHVHRCWLYHCNVGQTTPLCSLFLCIKM